MIALDLSRSRNVRDGLPGSKLFALTGKGPSQKRPQRGITLPLLRTANLLISAPNEGTPFLDLLILH